MLHPGCETTRAGSCPSVGLNLSVAALATCRRLRLSQHVPTEGSHSCSVAPSCSADPQLETDVIKSVRQNQGFLVASAVSECQDVVQKRKIHLKPD